MNWKKFLEHQGAEFVQDKLVNFGAPKRENQLVKTTTIISPLIQYSILKISGEDAKDFLANQLTNDIHKVTPNLAQLTAWCTHQGKVITTLVLFQHQDFYYALIYKDLTDKVTQRLQMFVLNSKVKIELMSNLVAFETYGGDLKKSQLPQQTFTQKVINDIITIKLEAEKPGFLFIGETQNMQILWQELSAHCVQVGENARNLISIRTLIPQISLETSELFTPHMLNMPQIPMVDFKKGCFPGQEVVARTEYLGKTKHKMYHILIPRSTKLGLGSKLKSIESKSSKASGFIVKTAINDNDQLEALAVLEVSVLSSITDIEGNSITILTSPD